MQEAKHIVKLYFDNTEYIMQVKKQYPEEVMIMQSQRKLAQALMEESIQDQFDVEKTNSLMCQLATLITQKHGITNYEFTESGLLRAVQQFLTVPPSQSLREISAEEEQK